MDEPSDNREGGRRSEARPIFSDDYDFSSELETTESRGSLRLGLAIGGLVFVVATVLLIAVITQLAVARHPGKMDERALIWLGAGGFVMIVMGTIATIRAVVAISERSKGRFSLLSVFVVMTLLCMVLGFIAYALRR